MREEHDMRRDINETRGKDTGTNERRKSKVTNIAEKEQGDKNTDLNGSHSYRAPASVRGVK